MHGIATYNETIERRGPLLKAKTWLFDHRRWCLIVLLPTVFSAAYLYLVASDQYQSEAHFVVRTADKPDPPQSGLSAALSAVSGGGSDQDAEIVADYLTSHDAVTALQKRVDLIGRFRRPGVDPVSRLWFADPTPETLMKYYLRMVDVKSKTDNGIATLTVKAFQPEDSYVIANALLGLAEDRVNTINRRNYESAVSVARQQMDVADRAISDIQSRMTAFRHNQSDFDPSKTGTARIELVAQLQGQLAAARAQADSLAAALSPSAPQVVAARRKVAAMAQQVAAEQSQIASGPRNVATGLGTYEELQTRQEFVGKQYEASASALIQARQEAGKQQLFIVRVVEPNMPVKALFPERAKIVATIFFALLLSYGIGWLILAGVKEHTA